MYSLRAPLITPNTIKLSVCLNTDRVLANLVPKKQVIQSMVQKVDKWSHKVSLFFGCTIYFQRLKAQIYVTIMLTVTLAMNINMQ